MNKLLERPKPDIQRRLAFPLETNRAKVTISLLAILGLFIVEFALYQHYFLKHVAPFCPVNDDQLFTYLFAYRSHLMALEKGPLCILTQPDLLALAVPMKGVILPWLAYTFSSIAGCDRWSVGAVNFLLFCIGQAFTATYVYRKRGTSAAAIALGLFVGATTHYHVAGGMNDMRLDYAGMVAMGACFIAIVTAINTRSLYWLGVSAFTLLVATNVRSILLFYWCATLLCCTVIFQVLSWSKKEAFSKAPAWRNQTIAIAFGALANLLLYFGLHWESFSGYYVNCKTSGEAVERASWDGVRNLADLLRFYAKSFLQHFEKPLECGALLMLFSLVPSNLKRSGGTEWKSAETIAIVVCVCLCVSVFTLAAGYAPSPVVMGVLLIPLCVCLSFVSHFAIATVGRTWLEMLAALAILTVGIFTFSTEMLHPTNPPHRNRADGARANTVLKDMSQVIAQCYSQNCNVSWLLCDSDINYVNLELFQYEAGRKTLSQVRNKFLPALPAKTLPELRSIIKDADLVVIPITFPLQRIGFFNYSGMQGLQKEHHTIMEHLSRDYRCAKRYDMSGWTLGIFTKKTTSKADSPDESYNSTDAIKR